MSAVLQEANQSVLRDALSHISVKLSNRLGPLTASSSTLDVCECLTAVVYIMSSACRLEFVSRAKRRESFERANWDRLGRLQSADDMVESGFYSLQDGDHVKCFFCDLGLRDWGTGDSPEMEHAKFSPLCFFLKSSRGLDWLRRSSAPSTNYPSSYLRQDHNLLLKILWEEFKETKVLVARSVGFSDTKVLLCISRSFIRHRRKLTRDELIAELQRDWDSELFGREPTVFDSTLDLAIGLRDLFKA